MLTEAFPAPVWVTGQLDGWAKGHELFFDLIDRAEGIPVARAKIRALIPREHRSELLRAAETAGLALRDGLQVRLQGTVGLWVKGGSYQFTVTAVDANYTLAQLQENRARVLASLRTEGIEARNLALPLPTVPLRVGVISAQGSDALHDLLATLRGSGFGFRVLFHHARVQGQDLQTSMVEALRWFYRHHAELDVLCIVRGGGSRSDLAQFDSLAIARGVCHQKVPVMVGIGHESDMCVLDDVARSCRTPTAVGTALVDQVGTFLAQMGDSARRLAATTRHRTDAAHLRNDFASRRLRSAADRLTRGAQLQLEALSHALGHTASSRLRDTHVRLRRSAQRLSVAATGHLRAERRALHPLPPRLRRAALTAVRGAEGRLEILEARHRAADPAQVLKRGFAIVRAGDSVLTAPAQAPPGTPLCIELSQGTLLGVSHGEADE
jgi:exodeoxyribonuclease VII large subunit